MLLVFASLMVLSVPAYATPLEQEDPFLPTETGNEEWSEWKLVGTFTENEFDMYLALQGMSEEQLAEAGYEESDILELKNTSIEELLYQRAQMLQSNGPVDKSKNSAETHRFSGRTLELEIEKDSIYNSFKV